MRGIAALLRLEWTVLGPARAGAVLLAAYALVAAWVAAPVGAPVHALVSTLQGYMGFAGVFAFALGLGRLTPELVGGYAEHLDALPAGRGIRWLVKVTAGAALLTVLLFGAAGGLAVVAAAAPLTGAEPVWDLLPPLLLASGVALVAAYAAGLVLGWIGPAAWGVVVLGAASASAVVFPSSEVWIPYTEAWFTPTLAWGARAFHAGPLGAVAALSALAAGISLVVYRGPGDVLARGGARVSRRLRLVAKATVGGLVVGGAATVVVSTLRANPRLYTPTVRVELPGITVLQRRDDPAADRLVAALPAVDRALRDRFGLSDTLTLDVELSSGTRAHAGFTTPTKIRLAPETGLPTLRHELAHAATQDRLGRSFDRCGDSLRFFVEGIAEDVETDGDTAARADAWRFAAAVYREGHGRFGALLDEYAYVTNHDEASLYSLGFTFVDHLRTTYEDPALLALLDAMGERCDQPPGLARWHAAARAAGLDLTEVVAGWHAALAAEARRLGPGPDLSGVLRGRGDSVWIEVLGGGDTCRFRGHAGGSEEVLRQDRVSNGRCRVPNELVRWDRVEFQLGYELGYHVVYGPWRTAMLSR